MNGILAMFLPIIMTASINGTAIKDENDTYISETARNACYEIGGIMAYAPNCLLRLSKQKAAAKPMPKTADAMA